MEEIVQDLCAGVVLVEADLEVMRDVHSIEFDDTGFGFAEDEDWRDILSSAGRSSVECGLDLAEQRGKGPLLDSQSRTKTDSTTISPSNWF